VQEWYGDVQTGFSRPNDSVPANVRDDGKHKNDSNKNRDKISSHCRGGGLFVVCLILELLEDLQFTQWNNLDNPMHPQWTMKTGVVSVSSSSDAIPSWYIPSITLLQHIGRTVGGMKLLRSRVLDDRRSDWMGNVLDVSIRHLHALAFHWEDSVLQNGGMIVNSVQYRKRVRDDNEDPGCVSQTIHQSHQRRQYERSTLQYAVEGWVRLWHQVLMFVQQNHEDRSSISFRSLSIDLQEWHISAYATLVASSETRPEIKSMIRLQLEELSLDEEEHEELKVTSQLRQRQIDT
jgi:hypothetical protein